MGGVPCQRKMLVLPRARLESSVLGEPHAGLWGLSAFLKRYGQGGITYLDLPGYSGRITHVAPVSN